MQDHIAESVDMLTRELAKIDSLRVAETAQLHVGIAAAHLQTAIDALGKAHACQAKSPITLNRSV